MKDIFSIQNKKFLVTGGTGFIGRGLVHGLLRSGARVRTLDNDSRGAQSKLGADTARIETISGDIRDPEIVRKAVHDMDAVCHLAYINGTEFFYTKPDIILAVAVKGMMNILDACIEQGVKNIFLASSSEVYQTPPVVPTDERVPLIVPDVLNPRYSYGGGKIISELLLVNYGRKHLDRAVIFRPHNVYGPDMGWEHVIPQFSLRLKKMAAETNDVINFPIQGTGDETRTFIYIDDFVRALLMVIENGKHLNVYHIGTSQEIAIKKLAEMMARCFDRKIRIIPGQLLQGSTLRRCPDVSKLTGLGFRPEVDLAEGLTRTVAWYQDHNPPERSEQI